MLLYRFRITSQDHEDFVREIEIQPTQTFLDFNEIIISCSDLEPCQNAIFFVTDKKYKPHQQISYKQQKRQVKKYDQELDEIITETAVLNLMKDSQLKKFIEDPHQKMIYEFTGKEFHVFNIELFKIFKTEEYYLLPRCTKKTGDLPKKVEIPVPEREPLDVAMEKLVIPTIPSILSTPFEGIHEDESELAEIESHLDEFLDTDEHEEHVEESPSSKVVVEDLYGSLDEEEEENGIESLEDFDDIENLEMRNRSYDHDSDEY
ncbi:MAG: hypothetical protein WCL00_02440 [Bacteroidota bacterium]